MLYIWLRFILPWPQFVDCNPLNGWLVSNRYLNWSLGVVSNCLGVELNVGCFWAWEASFHLIDYFICKLWKMSSCCIWCGHCWMELLSSLGHKQYPTWSNHYQGRTKQWIHVLSKDEPLFTLPLSFDPTLFYSWLFDLSLIYYKSYHDCKWSEKCIEILLGVINETVKRPKWTISNVCIWMRTCMKEKWN